MNKISFPLLILFFSFVSIQGKAEDCLDRFVKLTKEHENLQKRYENLEKEQKVKLDSISSIVNKLETKIKTDSIESLKGLKVLKDSITSLKNEIQTNKKYKSELDNLKRFVAEKDQTITKLNNTIKQKEEEIVQEKKNSDFRVSQSYEKGKLDTKRPLESVYMANSLDQIIELSTKGSIERDLKLFDNKTSFYEKLQYALIYFQSLDLLTKKYNSNLVADAKSKLKAIHGSTKAESLWTLLDNYSSMTDGLYSSIDMINEIDKKESVKGMGENVQLKKYAKIFRVLSDYVFDYGLKAEDYPYIYNIWVQILNTKKENPDVSIINFQQQLK